MAKPSWIELELARQTLTLLGVTMPTPVGGGGMAVGDLPAALTALGVPQPTPAAITAASLPAALTTLGVTQPTPAAGLTSGTLPAALTALGVPQPTPTASGGPVVRATFNGTGAIPILDSQNLSSITDNGTGDYTLNFATPLAHLYYQVLGSARDSNNGHLLEGYTSPVRTTSAVRVWTLTTNTGTLFDPTRVCVVIFA